MKSEDLLQAIGGLPEDILAESENKPVHRPKSILWRAAAAAAILSLLTITAAAVGYQFLNLDNAAPRVLAQDIPWTSYTIDQNGFLGEAEDSGTGTGVRIYAEIATNPEAPVQLENAYVPEVPSHWVLCGAGYALTGEKLSQFGLSWEPYSGEDGTTEDTVSFRQESAYFYNTNTDHPHCLETLMGIPEWVQVTAETTTLAGISVLQVTIPAFSRTETEAGPAYMSSGEIHLFWSDGNSIFRLRCPGWMDDAEIEEILASLHPVDNIQNYLDTLRQAYIDTHPAS